MRVKIRVQGDHGAFVLRSLLARLPQGVSWTTSDASEATLEVEPLRLLQGMLHTTLTEIDPSRDTSVDWRVESVRDHGEAPSVEDIDASLAFDVVIDAADPSRVDAIFPIAADAWPGGLLYRDSGTTDEGAYRVSVEMLPRWLVERAVSDAIREYDPTLALSLGRVHARFASDAPVTLAEASEEYPEGPVVIEGVWVVLAYHGTGWLAEHPSTGLTEFDAMQATAIEGLIAKVQRRANAAG